MARSGKSKMRRPPAGESASSLPSRLRRYWPRVVAIVVCLAVGGVVLERLTRPKEEAPPAKTPAPVEAASGEPVSEVPSAAAAKLTLDELIEATRQLAARLEETLPQSADALNLAAAIHDSIRDSGKAMECWDRTLKLRPDSPAVHYNLGMAIWRLGDYQTALSHFRQTHAATPELEQTPYYLADCLLKLGEADRAIAVLEEARDPGRYGAKGRSVLGHAYAQRGDLEKAKEHFEAALALNPKYVNAHLGLVRVFIRLKQPEKVKEHRDAVADLEKNFRYSTLADRSTEAEQMVLDADSVAVSLDAFYRSAADIYRRYGRPREAKELLLRADLLRPN